MISGQEEDKTHTRIKGPHSTDYYDNKIIESQSFKSSEEIKIKIEFSGVYSLCFISKSNSDIVTSFEYFTANESGHLINIAKNGVFEEIYKNVTTVSYLFEEIERNLKYYVERKETHAKIIEDVIALIGKLTFYKIFIILLITCLQIFLIRKFFKSDKQINYTNIPNDKVEKGVYL